jgi:ribonucleoside-triphosphate reductase (thioredoxin)
VHARHNDYYIRRIRVGKDEAIYKYLKQYHPELVEDEYFRPDTIAVISIPQKSPDDARLRTEPALDTLERVKKMYMKWIKPGHIKGENTHNVSCTISLKSEEWEPIGKWMWENRKIILLLLFYLMMVGLTYKLLLKIVLKKHIIK